MPERRTSASLGPAEVRRLCRQLDLVPSKKRGQNFVHDANTVRRIVAAARLGPDDRVLEIGPGLGSLTLALLDGGWPVTAVEVDPRLARALPDTVRSHLGQEAVTRLTVLTQDALGLQATDVASPDGRLPTALVANLPYNVAVPVLLDVLGRVPALRTVLVMVQSEVADRLTALPGSRTYGAPSVKLAWFGCAEPAGTVPRSVFWPVPNVDSALVRLAVHPPPATTVSRADVFATVDAAFAQRRKSLRAALTGWAGSASAAETALREADVDPSLRGERLGVAEFVRIAEHRPAR